jgi:hypothetical protein
MAIEFTDAEGGLMKRAAAVMLMLALALTGCSSDQETPTGPSISGPLVFTAQLQAANEVPPVANAEAGARGAVTITFDVPRDVLGNISGGGTATFAVQLNSFPLGTPAILAHIHTGAAGVAGPVFIDTRLTPAAPLLLGDGTVNVALTNPGLLQNQAMAVAANPSNYYFNVHTPLNPAGAVRGQLVRVQ